jgi:hypothetical protein
MQDGAIAADGNPDALMRGDLIPLVFGIRWENGRWRPIG